MAESEHSINDDAKSRDEQKGFDFTDRNFLNGGYDSPVLNFNFDQTFKFEPDLFGFSRQNSQNVNNFNSKEEKKQLMYKMNEVPKNMVTFGEDHQNRWSGLPASPNKVKEEEISEFDNSIYGSENDLIKKM